MARGFIDIRTDRGRRTRRLLLALMALGFACLVAAAIAAAWVTSQIRDYTYWVNHTYKVEQAIADYRVAAERAETARRGYLINGQPAFRATFVAASEALAPALDKLGALVVDNQSEVARVVALKQGQRAVDALRAQTIALVDANRMGDAMRAFRNDGSVPLMAQMRATTRQMAAAERTLLAQRDAAQQHSYFVFEIILAIAGVLLVLVVVTTWVTVLRYIRDLTATSEQLSTLNQSLESAVAERTGDLVRANEEIQRFAYIVSHDLRAPLVNVMGFTAELDAATRTIAELIERAETEAPALVTDEARLAATEDLPEAIGFIRSSTAKMDALINAILKLSREGRRVLAPEPIDMDALVARIGDTLQHRLAEREAELIVEHPLPAIVSDRLAIDQILSNIIENAIKYLQAGRPGRIVVRGRIDGIRALFEVEDNGRGIDPRDHARVFDLFRRSGAQDQPGEGIGLAHVRALVYRLGGIIDVTSELGKGATFRLSLPLTFLPAQDDTK
ncbi:MAG: sensor histidine kinase [Sphingomonas sp.]